MEYTFNNGFQSDDQIINQSTYTLSLDIDTLLDNSQTSVERFQRGELSRPPKWLNEFILYRKDKMASPEFKNRIAENKRAGNVSKEIGDLWDTEPEHVKLFFRALARKAKQRHSKNYGQRTENELEPAEEQVYPIDQTFIEQSQHSFNYIQDNNTQYLLFAHPVLSSPNLNPDGPISFEYYPSAQQAHDYPSWNGGNETAQETHDLIVTAGQQGYYYPSWNGGNETAQETHDMIVTAAQQGYSCPFGEEINGTAQETHDLIVTAAQQGYYCPFWDEIDGIAQETHDLIVTAGQQGYYYPSWNGGNETAQETHDLIVTAGQQGYYYPSWVGGNETAQETHDLIVTAVQRADSDINR